VKTAAQLVQDHPELLVGSHAQIIERLDFLLLDARIAGLREAAEIAKDTAVVEATETYYCQLGDAPATRSAVVTSILNAAAQLEKERKV